LYFLSEYKEVKGKMDAWKKWVVVLAGLVAAVGQFWGAEYYLPLVGGVVALVVGLLLK
jgi:hypothetical protein